MVASRWTGAGGLADSAGVSRPRSFLNVVDLVNGIVVETRASRQGRVADHVNQLDFVVFDDLGYLRIAPAGGQLLFDLVSQLFSAPVSIITTKVAVRE